MSIVFHNIAFLNFLGRRVCLQFKELNINSYTVYKTCGYAALTGVPSSQVQNYLWVQDRNLKLEPLPHIVFFLLACKNSDALVFTVSLYPVFDVLEL